MGPHWEEASRHPSAPCYRLVFPGVLQGGSEQDRRLAAIVGDAMRYGPGDRKIASAEALASSASEATAPPVFLIFSRKVQRICVYVVENLSKRD